MKKVQHLVLLKFKSAEAARQWGALYAALAALRKTIPGILAFSGGPYSSPEGLNQGFTHGFVMTFASAADRNRYLDHPDHEQVKRDFLPYVEHVIAFDYEEDA